METAILTGIGLAAPAGLNAYVPLLVLALADRATTYVNLSTPYDALSSNVGIAIIVVLLTIEIAVDKVPGLDHANDIVQSFVRPAAGAIVALASTSGLVTVNPAVMVLLGLVLAGSVNAVKVTTRPVVTVGTGGILNPFVSIGEDVLATFASLAAIFVPALVLVFLAIFAVSSILLLRRLRQSRASGGQQ